MRIKRRAAMWGALFGLAAIGATSAGPLQAKAERENWTAKVTITENGSHILGNPDAKVKLTEYVSYTCPHCATFQKEAETPLRLAYVMPGKVSVKVQHVVRDPVDLTVAMLTNCGSPDGFFKRHHTFLYGQEKWLARMGGMSSGQRKRWYEGEMAVRLQAVARDFGFYQMMEQHGVSRIAVNRCLGDKEAAQKIVSQTEKAQEAGITGTPGFALDGTVLAATHDWKTLDLQIKARF